MKKGFWSKLKKPILVLAPMADVTDAAFRRLIAKYGKPDVMWTEFVSIEGLLSRGKKALLPDLWYEENERPIVAQIFGGKPEKFYEGAQLIKELGFDGIDINMGCPITKIEKSGAGCDLIKDPERAKKIILETKRGAGDLPVSVKTRIGYKINEIDSWVKHLLETEPAAISMHARTKKEMSKVPARWDVIKDMVGIVSKEIPKKENRPTLLGNGDVLTLEDAEKKIKETGVDGVMFGRAIFGNPFLFSKEKDIRDLKIKDRLKIMLEHTKLFEDLFGEGKSKLIKNGRIKNFAVMKKHYKAYINGFDGAKELRIELMQAQNFEEVEKMIKEF